MSEQDKNKIQTLQDSLDKARHEKDALSVVPSTIHPMGAVEVVAVGEASLMHGNGKKWVRVAAWIVWGVPSIVLMLLGLYLAGVTLNDEGFSISTLFTMVIVGFSFFFIPGIYLYILTSKKKGYAPSISVKGGLLHLNGLTETDPIKIADIEFIALDFDKNNEKHNLLLRFRDGSAYNYLFNGYDRELVEVVKGLKTS